MCASSQLPAPPDHTDRLALSRSLAGTIRRRLLFVLLCATATLSQPDVSRAGESLTAPSKVTVSPDGPLLIDGEPVFPITLTIIPPPGAETPEGKPAYQEFRDGGVTFMRTGGPRWDEEMLEKELEYQRAAARAGLRCATWLGWDLSNIEPGDATAERQLRHVIARLKDSPGMGVWKGADEPEWNEVPPGEVANTARIIREEDPDRPIWIVQAPRGTVASMKQYDDGWDIGGIDIYPVSYPPGRHTIEENKELSMVGDFTRMIGEVADGKPFWMTLQIAYSGTIPPKGILRFPTFSEQRFMAYQAIIKRQPRACLLRRRPAADTERARSRARMELDLLGARDGTAAAGDWRALSSSAGPDRTRFHHRDRRDG